MTPKEKEAEELYPTTWMSDPVEILKLRTAYIKGRQDEASGRPSDEEVWNEEFKRAKFWSNVEQMDFCWEWRGIKNHDGYGMFRSNGIADSAHRYAWTLFHGSIPEGMHILHSCDNPACVNPGHLRIGTHKENMLDKSLKHRGRSKMRSSKYVGVGYRTDSKNWRSYLIVDGKTIRLGSYSTDLEAAQVREKYILENNLTAALNFPKNIDEPAPVI